MTKNKQIEITPGTPRFNKMVFRLTKPLNDKLLQAMDYGGNHLQKIQPEIYAMPVYVTNDFNLFMVLGKLVANDWVATFSKATIKNHNQVTDLSDPMPTGKGLNLLGPRNPKAATRLLRYFQTLIEAGDGEWRLVK